jgi:cytochrome P450 PksS
VVKVKSNINIASSAFKANPYPFYARLRAEAPVFSVRLPDKQIAWLVTRYDDVVSVLKDERFAKDRLEVLTPQQVAKLPWVPKRFMPLSRNMLDLDAPDHTRLRSLVHKAFTPRLVEKMRERAQALTEELLDRVERRGKIDLIREYALPLPIAIISQMLGIPERDRNKFHRWSNGIVSATSSKIAVFAAIPYALSFMRYIRKLIEFRRAHPADDLLTALVQAEEAGDQMNADELMAMVFLLLIAGHETTVNLIGNGTLALLEFPGQMEKLRDDPGMIKSAVEELLRFHSPLDTATERYVREDLTLSGTALPRGSLVYAVLASANRDESQFERADQLDLARANNKHVSFGLGAHYCLGAPLARLEAQIAINTLLRRLPQLRLAIPHQELRWRKGLVLRGLETLPLEFTKKSA